MELVKRLKIVKYKNLRGPRKKEEEGRPPAQAPGRAGKGWLPPSTCTLRLTTGPGLQRRDPPETTRGRRDSGTLCSTWHLGQQEVGPRSVGLGAYLGLTCRATRRQPPPHRATVNETCAWNTWPLAVTWVTPTGVGLLGTTRGTHTRTVRPARRTREPGRFWVPL